MPHLVSAKHAFEYLGLIFGPENRRENHKHHDFAAKDRATASEVILESWSVSCSTSKVQFCIKRFPSLQADSKTKLGHLTLSSSLMIGHSEGKLLIQNWTLLVEHETDQLSRISSRAKTSHEKPESDAAVLGDGSGYIRRPVVNFGRLWTLIEGISEPNDCCDIFFSPPVVLSNLANKDDAYLDSAEECRRKCQTGNLFWLTGLCTVFRISQQCSSV
eukprot:scaffold22680_cov107-Cylindrotheca_fusiformis.AAC.14